MRRMNIIDLWRKTSIIGSKREWRGGRESQMADYDILQAELILSCPRSESHNTPATLTFLLSPAARKPKATPLLTATGSGVTYRLEDFGAHPLQSDHAAVIINRNIISLHLMREVRATRVR